MGDSLTIAIAIFLASTIAVTYLGYQLARYGDALAALTGWGRLFVGGLLVALATSLPEVSTIISAVRLDPPNPELSVGSLLGANMKNILTLAIVALLFGSKRFIERVSPAQGYLIALAAVLTGLAVLFAALRLDISLWEIGIPTVVIMVVYVIGMRIVYVKRPEDDDGDEAEDPGMSLARAWIMFTLVSVGVVISGFFLAFSADGIAEITGVASSAVGILGVAFVTTMPEMSAAIAAARIGAADLAVGNLYGSCVFNISILAYADPFYREGVLLSQSEPSHFIAGFVAIFLILFGWALIVWRDRLHQYVVASALVLIVAIWLVGAIVVAGLGAPDGSAKDGEGTRTVSASAEVIQ